MLTATKEHSVFLLLKVEGNEKGGGSGSRLLVRIGYRTVAIDVCLLFNVAVVFSATYFRILFVKRN